MHQSCLVSDAATSILPESERTHFSPVLWAHDDVLNLAILAIMSNSQLDSNGQNLESDGI